MKLYFRELGQGDPIVIIHGVFGSSDNWLTTAKELANHYHVYLVDLRNHGQSPHSSDFNYEVMSQDLNEFLMDQGIEKPVVIGHSMGGKVAMRYAAEYNNIQKLVVVDISPRYYRKHHDSILQGLNSLDLQALTTRQEADTALSAYVLELGVRQFLLKNLYRNAANEFAWRLNLQVITEKIEQVGEALDEQARIDCPTLFIKGSNSKYIQEEDEVLIRRIFSDVNIETIDGAGHWVQAEKPTEFLKITKHFIEEPLKHRK